MKKSQASSNPLRLFQTGQVWRMEDSCLRIGQVGNLLVHYQHYKGKETKITKTKGSSSYTSKRELETFLTDHKAVLVAE